MLQIRFERLTKVLHIENMEAKHGRMINCFKLEMERIAKFFKKQQSMPPVPRNFPDASGRILWVRSLLSHLAKFIDCFEAEAVLVKRPDYRKLVRQYNELGTELMKFELEVEREQKNPKIRRIEKMLAKPVLKIEEDTNQLMVNFDPRLIQMLRENERLCKLDIAMPR